MIELLLSAAIGAGLDQLAEVVLGEPARELRDRLLNTDKPKRHAAFLDAWNKAKAAVTESAIGQLLDHRPFQEAVVVGLLDPVTGFDVQAAARDWQGRLPEHAPALRRFFNALESALTGDEFWGDILERYRKLRTSQEAQDALSERRLPSERQLVQQVSVAVSSQGILNIGDHNKIIGPGSILVEGDLIQKIINVTNQYFIGGPDGSKKEAADLRQRYLQRLANQANLLPWASLSTDQAGTEGSDLLQLEDVYIELDTNEPRHLEREEELRSFMEQQREQKRISAQELLDQHSCLLLMGDPGSGKSTFVKYLTYVLAQAGQAGDPASWLEKLSPWQWGALFPVWVELRLFADYIQGKKPKHRDTLLCGYLQEELKESGLEGFWPDLQRMLENPAGGVLILLDGLDEAPAELRERVIGAIQAFCSLHQKQRYVVTCRPYAYIGQPYQLTGFHEAVLAPFSQEQIDRFIQKWYHLLQLARRFDEGQARDKADSLQKAVRRRDLLELAERPLLLTAMAQLDAYRGKLPDDRTQLYANMVDLLMQRWEGRLGQEDSLLVYLDIPEVKKSDLMTSLMAGLYEVAHRAHEGSQGQEGVADISEADLRDWLAPYLGGDFNRAQKFVNYIRERAGLLVRHKPKAYRFPHRSFQEFLAACYWLGREDFSSHAASLVCADWDKWREVFLLAAGYAARSNRLGAALAAVNAILPASFQETPAPQALDWQSAQLAGEALLEVGLLSVQREKTGQVVLERDRGWLKVALGQDGKVLEARQRARAGDTLARLGDPRPEIMTIEGMPFCFVPGGSFLMGSDEEKDPQSDEDERKQHSLTLPDFWIGRYPVSNAQYAAFMQAEGYRQEGWWTEARDAGVWADGLVKGRYDEQPRAGPVDYGEPYRLENHPVVGVTWYEALAFCRWLSERLKAASAARLGQTGLDEAQRSLWRGLAQGKLAAALPSEAEWEKAARGVDGRIYPWMGDFDSERANTSEARIGATSALGCFPGGESPCGCQELSGNVWEWTRSLWGKDWQKPEYRYPYDPSAERENLQSPADAPRVLRGGSFLNYARFARCAYRYWYYPDHWYYHYGFRVVVRPLSPGL